MTYVNKNMLPMTPALSVASGTSRDVSGLHRSRCVAKYEAPFSGYR